MKIREAALEFPGNVPFRIQFGVVSYEKMSFPWNCRQEDCIAPGHVCMAPAPLLQGNSDKADVLEIFSETLKSVNRSKQYWILNNRDSSKQNKLMFSCLYLSGLIHAAVMCHEQKNNN